MIRLFWIVCLLAFSFMASTQSVAAVSSAIGFDQAIGKAKAAVQVDPRKAIIAAREADRYAETFSDPARRIVMHATVQWLTGEAYLRIDEGALAIPLIEKAYSTIDRIQPNTNLHADLLLSMGGISVDRGDVAAALAYYQRAHRVFQKIGDTRGQAKALIQIANLYYEANDWGSSLRYFTEALDSYDADPGLSSSAHNGLGLALKELQRATEAKAEFAKALALARDMKSPLLVATVLNNAARLDLASGDLARADRAIAESRRATGSGTPPEFGKQQDALAAQAAFQHRDYRRAAKLVESIFAGVDLTNTSLAEREAHRTAYLTYQELGRDDLALAHLRALKRLDDDATNLARSTGAALMSARFDFANQSLRIANLKARDAQQSIVFERARARSQRIIFYGTSGATLVVISLLLYALRTSRRGRVKVQAAADDLAVTNEALGKALAAKTEFLATTSHEIRTPLNGILGMTQVMLVDETLSARTRDRVGVVHEAGVTMRALVDDILDVAKMETGNLTIEQAPFDLKKTVIDATRLWAVQADAKGLAFVRLLDDCPDRVCGDMVRVRQIVFNLLSNALKFTASGTISLEIAASAPDRYRIVVADEGIGIAPDKMETIFESFRQADTSTTRQFGGTGLGLSICRSLARAMGGEIGVDSVEGEGTRFFVDLPLVVPAPVVIDTITKADRADLLIVDRNPITRNMVKALFEPYFAAIGFAGSIDEAINRIPSGAETFVLADDATVREGDVARNLTRLVAATDGPVALLWPVSAETERQELLDTGIDCVVAKPVTGASLVEQLVSLRRNRRVRMLVSDAA